MHGVDLGQGGADDYRVADASAEHIDTFGEAAAEHEEESVGEGERFIDPGGLGGEVALAGLDRGADGRMIGAKGALDRLGVGVAGEEDGDRAMSGGMEGGDGRGGGGVVTRALLVGGVHAHVVGDVVGCVAPGCVRGDGSKGWQLRVES